MTDTEILTKAIKKAVKNGFPYKDGKPFGLWQNEPLSVTEGINSSPFKISKEYIIVVGLPGRYIALDGVNAESIIFRHDFAKAFWGKEKLPMPGGYEMYEYEYHLQQMVLEQEPIKYLAKYL